MSVFVSHICGFGSYGLGSADHKIPSAPAVSWAAFVKSGDLLDVYFC